MSINDNYIQREYLALKINTCRLRLAQLPNVRIRTRRKENIEQLVCIYGNHIYKADMPTGAKLVNLAAEREVLEADLKELVCRWHKTYKGNVPEDVTPRNVIRKLSLADSTQVVMDRAFFDGLKNDANPNYRENKRIPFNGINYRSSSERDIAIYYTENKIPFKYEPEIWLNGLTRPVYPDFVFMIEELNSCKFHEHLGLMNSSNYIRDTGIKYSNYTRAGLLPGFDVIFTYDFEDMPFDIRYMDDTINSLVHRSLLL